MAESNTALVDRAVEAFNRGDWQAFYVNAAGDFQVDLSRATGPDHGVFDLEEARDRIARFGESWESMRIETERTLAAGEHVAAAQTLHARGRDGIEVPSRVTWVWTFEAGELKRLTMYQQWDDAMEALGV